MFFAETGRILPRLWTKLLLGCQLESARDQVLAALSPTLQIWLEEMEAALADLDQDQSLPQHLYLVGGGSGLPVMAEAVRALAWSDRLHFVRYPQVGRLQPTDVSGVINRTGLGRAAGDVTALALAAWAAYQSQTPDRPSRILHELCT